ncbi:MAG: cyclopropane-fatty-acyl-phospholipid synthase family protein [Actinomycetota bacterium]
MTRPVVAARPPAVAGAAGLLLPLIEQLFRGELPVRVRAWDGSEAGPDGAPVLVLHSRQALRRMMWHPGELGVAQAYVTGELDVEGDLTEGLRSVWRAARSRDAGQDRAAGPAGPPSAGSRVAGLAGSRVAKLAGPRVTGLAGQLSPARWRDAVPLPPALWGDALRTAIQLGIPGPRPKAPVTEARISGRLHSRSRDQAVIAHHYDVPPAFYELILDPLMAYSSGYWTSSKPGYTLQDAQRDKLDQICRKLALAPGMRLLDIGCGWGSLTVHAAQHYRARVTAVTLSREQAAHVRKRSAQAGLGELVEVRNQDYRDITGGPYDAVASVEMGEHVGAGQYPAFCRLIRSQLRPGGRVLIQQMSRGANAPGGGKFIEAYIAPDMHMRPVGETANLIEEAGLEVRDVEAMREHYPPTIRAWLGNLEWQWDEAVALIGRESARVWRLYLAGGALAFEEGRMGVDQILAVRPATGGHSGFPLAARSS